MAEEPEPEKSGGFVSNVLNLYVAPSEAFTAIVRRPNFWLPLGCHVLVALLFTAIWIHKVDLPEFMKAQMEASGQWDKIPAERRANILETQSKVVPIFSWVFATLGTAIVVVLTSAVLLFVYRFFYASEVTFLQALAIVAYSFLTVALVSSPLILLVMQLKGDWNINPGEALQANLTLAFEKATTAKPLWALASSLDLFSFWLLFLIASGFGVASRRTTGSAFWGVAVCWGVIVLGKVGFSFLQ
jgi:hypothetical protein